MNYKNEQRETDLTTAKSKMYKNVKQKPSNFQYLFDSLVEKLDILLEWLLPYSHAIKYAECSSSGIWAIDKKTKLLSVMTVYKHGLQNGDTY